VILAAHFFAIDAAVLTREKLRISLARVADFDFEFAAAVRIPGTPSVFSLTP